MRIQRGGGGGGGGGGGTGGPDPPGKSQVIWELRPSINGLVTDGNTKLCCRGFILALFRSTTAKKIYSEHTRCYKRLLPVCEAEILQVTVKRIEVFSSFYVDF